jgi:hypothetical protein
MFEVAVSIAGGAQEANRRTRIESGFSYMVKLRGVMQVDRALCQVKY